MSDEKSASKRATLAGLGLLAAGVLVWTSFEIRSNWRMQESAECHTRLKAIGGLIKAWRGSHEGRLPPDAQSLASMSSEPLPWRCPSEKSHVGATGYEMLISNGESPNKGETFARCKIHGHVCLADGSVTKGGDQK